MTPSQAEELLCETREMVNQVRAIRIRLEEMAARVQDLSLDLRRIKDIEVDFISRHAEL